MTSRVVVGITGMPGSGKSEAIRLLLRCIPGKEVVMRKVVEEDLQNKGMDVTNKSLREHATWMRETYGRDVIARKSLREVKEALTSERFVVVNGIRSVDETVFFKKSIRAKFVLIAVVAGPKARFYRLSRRGLKWDMRNWKSFAWRDRVELSWGLGDAIALADYTIANEGSLEHLRALIKSMSRHLLDELDAVPPGVLPDGYYPGE